MVERSRGSRTAPWHAKIAVCLGIVLLAGCSAETYRKRADKETYGVIDQKSPLVPHMPAEFRLDEPETDAPVPGEGSDAELALVDALRTAVCYSPEYRSRREDVYLAALSLTLSRHAFANQLSGVLDFLYTRDEQESKTAGTSTRTTTSTVGGGAGFSLTRTLAAGGQVTATLSTEFLRYLLGDPTDSISAAFDLTIRQPLLRGAGRRYAREGLVQAERDMIYELRDFVRFRRSFYVSVAAEYYRVLEQRDVVRNERVNLDNLTAARERAEELADAGRMPEFQVRQTEQDELSARDRWVRAVQNYESLLDRLKITLGLPTENPLALDPTQLVKVAEAGLKEVDLTRETATERAARHRLDLMTALDQVADAGRKVGVARNDLKPDVDLVLGAGGSRSRDKDGSGVVTRTWQGGYSAGFDVDLPLDRKSERNDYRAALIAQDRSARAHALLDDRIKQQVYSAWRRLEEARESYRIQQRSVELAERRVESATLLLDAGRVEVRDLLEAQEALLSAKNSLTSVLVDHRVALLELWRDMGTLAFEDGEFREEVADEGENDEQ